MFQSFAETQTSTEIRGRKQDDGLQWQELNNKQLIISQQLEPMKQQGCFINQYNKVSNNGEADGKIQTSNIQETNRCSTNKQQKLRSRTSSRQSIFSPRSASQYNRHYDLTNPNQPDQPNRPPFPIDPISRGTNRVMSDWSQHAQDRSRQRRATCRFSLGNIITHPALLYSVVFVVMAGIIFAIVCFGAGMVNLYGVSQNPSFQKVQFPSPSSLKQSNTKDTYQEQPLQFNFANRYAHQVPTFREGSQDLLRDSQAKYKVNKK